jgi:hypothetical protein
LKLKRVKLVETFSLYGGKNMFNKCLRIVFCFYFLNICNNLYAFDSELAHKFITEKAAQKSDVNEYLINELGLSSGLNTTLKWTNPLSDARFKEINPDQKQKCPGMAKSRQFC